MAELLTNVAVSDAYTNQATLGPTLGITQLVFQVFNEPIYARFFKPPVDEESNRQPTLDPTEHYFPVGTLLSVDGAAGVQFRNAIAGQPATINAQIGFAGDPIFDFQSSGLFSAAVLTLSFLHNNALQGAESALDFEDSSSIVWTVTDTPGTKEAVSAAFVSGSVVTSVFGRSGPAIVAVSGDYTAAQVTNAADKASSSTQAFTGSLATPSTATGTFGQTGLFLGNNGTIWAGAAATSTSLFVGSITGDTERRVNIIAGGTIAWGPGNAAVDLNVSRTAVNTLTVGTGAANSIGGTITTGPAGFSLPSSTVGAYLQAGLVGVQAAAAANVFLIAHSNGTDTIGTFAITSDGAVSWGPGTASRDVSLSRFVLGSTAILQLTGSGVDNGSLQMSGNVFEGFKTSAQAATSSYAPDALAAKYHTLTFVTAGGTLTLSNPTNPPTSATHTGTLIIRIVTSATAATAISYGTQYVAGGLLALPASVAAATERILHFQADYTSGSILWRLVALA